TRPRISDNLSRVSCVHVLLKEPRSMKRTFTIALCFVLFHSIVTADALALAPAPAPSRQSQKVAGAVARLGATDDSLVAARLHDHSVVKGRLTSIARDSFVVTDIDSGSTQRVFYAAVTRLQGVNIASGEQVQVGGGFKARVAQVATLLLPIHRVQRNSLTGNEKTLLIGIIVGVLLAIILAKAL
ncbi:MAG TPA: hypothetical protein VKP30_24905, partial [Polyangiaceae bacterium]|nr:hypothetical protein [Polyangiaceae bacterium]